jgi:hypothetical protein
MPILVYLAPSQMPLDFSRILDRKSVMMINIL